LGDGTVSYDSYNHVLTFENAVIEHDDAIVYSKIDLMIELLGENEFILTGEGSAALHIGNYLLTKDVAIFGDGSLSVEFKGNRENALGIRARNIRIESDMTFTMPDCENIVNGIYSDGSLVISKGATVTLNHGAAKHSTAVKARNNIDVELDSTLNVSARPGTTELCRGLNVGGSLVVWDNATLNVSVDDATARASECINVAGPLKLEANATLTASAKKIYGVECYGAMELASGASLTAASEGENVDLLCYGSIVNYGATVQGEADVLGEVLNK
jgi:hypothetical protein